MSPGVSPATDQGVPVSALLYAGHTANNPIRYFDPTGHWETVPGGIYLDGGNSWEKNYQESLPDILDRTKLTKSSKSATGLGGDQMYVLYLIMWADKEAWWWDAFGRNGFSVWDSMSTVAYFEANGNPEYAVYMPEAGVRWYNEVSKSAIPGNAEATLNWWGQYSQSAADRYKNGGLITGEPEYGGSPEYIGSVFSSFGDSFENSPGEWVKGYAKNRPFGWANIKAFWPNEPNKDERRNLMTNQSQALFIYIKTGVYENNFVIPSGCAWAVGEHLWKSTICDSVTGP